MLKQNIYTQSIRLLVAMLRVICFVNYFQTTRFNVQTNQFKYCTPKEKKKKMPSWRQNAICRPLPMPLNSDLDKRTGNFHSFATLRIVIFQNHNWRFTDGLVETSTRWLWCCTIVCRTGYLYTWWVRGNFGVGAISENELSNKIFVNCTARFSQ